MGLGGNVKYKQTHKKQEQQQQANKNNNNQTKLQNNSPLQPVVNGGW